MEQNLLLTAERLRLSPDIQRGWVVSGVLVMKNIPAQEYLTVSQLQARVLESFGDGATVPEVLSRLLQERRCPPLREFYELVVKAHEVGVLCKGPSRKPPRRAMAWRGWAAPLGALWPCGLLHLAAALVLAWRAPVLVEGWQVWAWVPGLLLAVVALSGGQFLAATLLVGYGGDVYSRRPLESLALLHPRLDLRDVRLLRPAEQALVALAAKLPLVVVVLAVALVWPAASLPLVGAWALVWRPWGGGLARKLLALSSRRPLLDTDGDFRFIPNQGPQLHWRPWWRRWDWRVCAFELIWAVAWSVLVAHLVLHGLGVGLFEALAVEPVYWLWAMQAIGAALLIAALSAVVRLWRDGARQYAHGRRLRRERRERRRREYVFPDTDAALLRLAGSHPLLALLSPYDRAALVRAWRPVSYPSRARLPDFETGKYVGLILSGQINAFRVRPSGRPSRVLVLEEQDLLGLSAPLAFGGEEVSLEFRSVTPVAAMLLPGEFFQSMVVEKIGVPRVHDFTYKYAFLRRLSLCANWDPAAVARFSRLAQVAVYEDGAEILRERSDTQWFYIVYDGMVRVRRGGREQPRMKAGDFFGEISLLQNSAAVADVTAQGRVTCLQIDRTSFLRFMTHNHRVALTLERISSTRLGHPIFPLRPAPVGVRGEWENELRRRAALAN